MSHDPAGTSVQNMIHLAQLVRSKKFAKYDYGFLLNVVRYGSFSPPDYKLENVKIPTVIFWGDNDILADPEDVHKMISRVPNIVRNFHSPVYDHIDYIWGLNANERVYDHILDILRK